MDLGSYNNELIIMQVPIIKVPSTLRSRVGHNLLKTFTRGKFSKNEVTQKRTLVITAVFINNNRIPKFNVYYFEDEQLTKLERKIDNFKGMRYIDEGKTIKIFMLETKDKSHEFIFSIDKNYFIIYDYLFKNVPMLTPETMKDFAIQQKQLQAGGRSKKNRKANKSSKSRKPKKKKSRRRRKTYRIKKKR